MTIEGKAVERLRHYEPPEGYFLAFSGGKDSVVIYDLAVKSGVKFDAWYSVTTIDPPELVRFIKKEYPDVSFIHPKKPFLKELVNRGFPMRQKRWCCQLYKENGGNNRCVITGIRWNESYNRSKRKIFEHCYSGGYKSKNKTFVNPIIDWYTADVWKHINDNELKYCSLYDEGWKRIGCLFCPMAPKKHRLQEVKQYPNYVKLYIKAFQRLYNKKKLEGKTSVDRWANGEEMFWWWVDEDNVLKEDEKQQVMIFE